MTRHLLIRRDFKECRRADIISSLPRIVNSVGMVKRKDYSMLAKELRRIANRIGAFASIGTLVSNQIQDARKVRHYYYLLRTPPDRLSHCLHFITHIKARTNQRNLECRQPFPQC